MSSELDALLKVIGDPSGAKAVPAERFEQFAGVLPPLLLEFWREVGFAGFDRGGFWLCDPVEWQPVVDLWTANTDLVMGSDRWHAVTRTAFGSLQLWGERTGNSLSIEPVHGLIFPSAAAADEMETEFDRNLQIEALMISESDSHDLFGSDGAPLFDRAVKAHGEVGPDTMYTFVPAYSLGGPLSVDHIEIADAVTHVSLLAELSPHRVMGDITRSL